MSAGKEEQKAADASAAELRQDDTASAVAAMAVTTQNQHDEGVAETTAGKGMEARGESGEERIQQHPEHVESVKDDLLFYAGRVCDRLHLSPEKRDVVQAIAHKLWACCMATPHNNMDEALDILQQELVRNSVQRPPWSEAILTYADCQAILDYFLKTFFAHYKLYKIVCTRQVTKLITLEGQQDAPAKAHRPLSEPLASFLKPESGPSVDQTSPGGDTQTLVRNASRLALPLAALTAQLRAFSWRWLLLPIR